MENIVSIDIVQFAQKYINYFEHEFGQTRESYYQFFESDDFPRECKALGFDMDCGHSFIEAYGKNAWNDIRGLKANIEKINDVRIIGNGLFSQWRYFNHWSSPSYANDDTKEWFLMLLHKLKTMNNK